MAAAPFDPILRHPGTSTKLRAADPTSNSDPTEVTDIIPFNEFGSLDDLDFQRHRLRHATTEVLRAPELDDLHDTDDLTPLQLMPPNAIIGVDPTRRRTSTDVIPAHRRRAPQDRHASARQGPRC